MKTDKCVGKELNFYVAFTLTVLLSNQIIDEGNVSLQKYSK